MNSVRGKIGPTGAIVGAVTSASGYIGMDSYNKFFGIWAGSVIQLSFAISVLLFVYVSLVIYRYLKKRQPYWNVELPAIPFMIMIVLIILLYEII